MARAWLINSRGIAKKVRNATLYSNHQIKDLEAEAKRECPNCKYVIDNSDVSLNWSGLPAGVKFDPTDIELLEHLSGKVGAGKSKAHIFIDEFIPTLDGDQGICYTHPENLPCIKKDGSSVHFFHRTSNAYATGCKKRRKIRNQYSESEERVRWHKTGKTKPVMENGVRKGWKKIMVLYKSLGKGCKPDKANWVMHQYHLGANEEENDGELVVSKVFCQKHTKQAGGGETEATPNELDGSNIRSPKTPKTVAPKPPSTKMSSMGEADEHNPVLSQFQEEHREEESEPSPLSITFHTDEAISSSWWACESKAIQQPDPWKIDDPLLCPEKIDDPLLCPEKIEDSLLCPEKIDDSLLCPEKIDDSLLCHEVLYPFTSIAESSLQLHYSDTVESNKEQFQRFSNTFDGFPTLDDINTDSHSDFHISDLQFGSQDSIMSWLDRI